VSLLSLSRVLNSSSFGAVCPFFFARCGHSTVFDVAERIQRLLNRDLRCNLDLPPPRRGSQISVGLFFFLWNCALDPLSPRRFFAEADQVVDGVGKNWRMHSNASLLTRSLFSGLMFPSHPLIARRAFSCEGFLGNPPSLVSPQGRLCSTAQRVVRPSSLV